VKKTIFTLLLQPIEARLAAMSEIIDHQALSQKLMFADFVKKLIFAYVYQVSSLRNLALELQTNPLSDALGLSFTPFSTLKDGFSRFQSRHFKQLFESLVAQTALKRIKALDELGLFQVIDGSLFPTLWQMSWTSYRKTKNAFKLHLSFELNRMIPLEFWVRGGNSSERQFLAAGLVAGITYIADRGYFSFGLAAQIIEARGWFVMRAKDNLLYEVLETLVINHTHYPLCLRQLTDEIVVFRGDVKRHRIRLITFKVGSSYFRLVTNRFDLTTLNIITLYAYRWQIELFFKFMKRTLKGLHLMNQSQNGVEIQFYMLMSVVLLMMKLKQASSASEKEAEKEKRREKKVEDSASGAKWIKEITKIFYQAWKITKNWLVVLRNSLAQPADSQLLSLLNNV
jgi:hypothetical protein